MTGVFTLGMNLFSQGKPAPGFLTGFNAAERLPRNVPMRVSNFILGYMTAVLGMSMGMPRACSQS